jgi:hypothetical protein
LCNCSYSYNHRFAVTNIKFSSYANAAPPIDGIRCEAMEHSIFHIHSYLSIFINDHNYAVPALIGITNNCFYWLHTHDTTGIIHIELPIKREFNLGELFDIWNKKFDNSHLFDIVVGDTKNTLNVYVNGIKVSNGTNYRDIVFHAHDVITIVYGKPSNAIPTKYDFDSINKQLLSSFF